MKPSFMNERNDGLNEPKLSVSHSAARRAKALPLRSGFHLTHRHRSGACCGVRGTRSARVISVGGRRTSHDARAHMHVRVWRIKKVRFNLHPNSEDPNLIRTRYITHTGRRSHAPTPGPAHEQSVRRSVSGAECVCQRGPMSADAVRDAKAANGPPKASNAPHPQLRPRC